MERAPVPFNRISVSQLERRYVDESMSNGAIGGDGPVTKRCEELLRHAHGGSRSLLTSSCTHALEMTALLLDVREGDEVIMPSFTFSSTANAFALRGAKLVFADIRPDTLNIDERAVAGLTTKRTKAVVVVHYAGIGCEMDAVMSHARAAGIAVVEDNAHGFLGSWNGRPLGTFGAMSTLSFHESKNISCGEGGALIVNEVAYEERAEILREKGTDRSRFLRGQVDKYSWVDIGSSYVLSDLLAGYLLAQLERREDIQRLRHQVWARYAIELQGWAQHIGARLPEVPAGASHPAHLFYIVMPAAATRDAFIAHMRDQGIGTAFHYVPLHNSKMALQHDWPRTACPVTEHVSRCLVRLPVYAGLTEAEQERVIATAREFRA